MLDPALIEERLGLKFRRKELLRTALTHRSYLNENRRWALGHNERLEFLGDAVLELVVTEHLYRVFPDKEEGELTSLRSALVRNDVLSRVARQLGVYEFLLLSRGASEEQRAATFILGGAYEALIGALYLDQGYEPVRDVIKRTLLPQLAMILSYNLNRDPKSLFQEEAQALIKITPHYELLKEEGPDHDRRFVVAVCLGEERVAIGEGRSKREAETQAAQTALKAKGWTVDGKQARSNVTKFDKLLVKALRQQERGADMKSNRPVLAEEREVGHPEESFDDVHKQFAPRSDRGSGG